VPIRKAVIMLDDLNLVTILLLLVALVSGVLLGVVSSRSGEEPAPRHTEISPETRFRDFWK
jgi:hypothetical protein